MFHWHSKAQTLKRTHRISYFHFEEFNNIITIKALLFRHSSWEANLYFSCVRYFKTITNGGECKDGFGWTFLLYISQYSSERAENTLILITYKFSILNLFLHHTSYLNYVHSFLSIDIIGYNCVVFLRNKLNVLWE